MVGEKLQQLLEIRKIKAGSLATLTGIPKSTIYSIIRRNNKSVDFSTMERIATALNVPVEYFYDSVYETDGSEQNKKPAPISEDGHADKDMRLIKWFRSLPEEKQKAILIAQDAPEDLL